ncbi:MAG: hypothetical protein SCK70_11765, partial [bacterium]|nr:hypothetical protein [bacterium]
MTKKITFFVSMLQIVIVSSLYSQQILADKLEIFMKTKDTGGVTVTFKTTCQGSIVWDDNAYITTESKFTNPIDLVIIGDYFGTEKGWDTSDDTDPDIPRLGRAELNGANKSYVIYVKNRTTMLKVDCFGNDFLGDVYVLYDYDDDKFYEDGTQNEITTIDLYDGPDRLQPTAPKNFQCTNPTSYGSHPNFSWAKPDHPETVQFTYYIYRDEGSGFHQIGSTTSTSYTDTGAEIDKFGNPTYYYVKAKGSHSPLSDASNTVQLKTDVASKRLLGNDSYPDLGNNDQSKRFVLLVSPNPFNPETKISYRLWRDDHVLLDVFNITGQHIA